MTGLFGLCQRGDQSDASRSRDASPHQQPLRFRIRPWLGRNAAQFLPPWLLRYQPRSETLEQLGSLASCSDLGEAAPAAAEESARVQWERRARDLNDRVHAALLSDPRASHGEFYCECGDKSCGCLVRVALEDYAAIRARRGRVWVTPATYRANDRTGTPLIAGTPLS
jgi:hypothetical protein